MSSGDDRDASVNGGSKDADPFELGNRHAERGEMDQAEEAYRRADEDGHGTAAAYAGVFAEARGDFDEARDAYRRADERGDGFGALRLGLLSAARGDWDEAKDAYARADERGHEQPPFDPRSLRPKRPPRDDQPAAVADGRPAFANPVLIGAVTVLIVMIAVFLAYNANTGLPFVPTRELKVDIANGSNLVVGNEVRSGGFRVGVISEMKPVALPSGQTGAQLIAAPRSGARQGPGRLDRVDPAAVGVGHEVSGPALGHVASGDLRWWSAAVGSDACAGAVRRCVQDV